LPVCRRSEVGLIMKVEADQADCLGGSLPGCREVAAPKRRVLGSGEDQGVVAGGVNSSRPHLRRAGPDGLDVSREKRARKWGGDERPGWPAVGGGVSSGTAPLMVRQLSSRPPGGSPAARRAAAPAAPVTGRVWCLPYPRSAARTRPSASRQLRRRRKGLSHGVGTPRIVRVGPSGLNGASHPAARDTPAACR
jgi:hypothetical protein